MWNMAYGCVGSWCWLANAARCDFGRLVRILANPVTAGWGRCQTSS
ncbi:hypothetical protein RB11816 [Rhodopirellula baltica SH 1]|uniref:Uncharacterized protein n=1 Tax=Rhodopirellula baltica (strain DSM 10527 / NCIMB 13988 / SH1) TaxID=243090 RepID=Q7UJL5_RHOBA|nr:hypothetical protein RB11816 [Rhodopirellula baltica SH 1]